MTDVRLRVGLFQNPAPFNTKSMARYAEALGQALLDLECSDAEFEHVVPETPRLLVGALGVPVLGRLAGQLVRFPAAMLPARKTDYDVNHVLDHAYAQLAFALDAASTVVTCHDVFPLKLWRGEIEGLRARRLPPLGFRLSLAGLVRAGAVIVPSEATKRDLVSRLGMDPDRVHVIPHGVSPAFSPHAASARDLLAGRSGRHVLVVDTGCAYKNPAAAIRMLERLAGDVALVRVGSRLGEQERVLAQRLGVSDRVIELGFVDEDVLAALYARCDVLFFPSFYEGFGWPVLEALASGTPVVCSTWSSLVEIAGDAALAAAPDDIDAFTDHVSATLDRPRLAESLRSKGLRRASEFTWQRAAERTLAVYEGVARAGSRLRRRPLLVA